MLKHQIWPYYPSLYKYILQKLYSISQTVSTLIFVQRVITNTVWGGSVATAIQDIVNIEERNGFLVRNL